MKCCKIYTSARRFSSLRGVVSYSCKLNLLHVVSMNCRIYLPTTPAGIIERGSISDTLMIVSFIYTVFWGYWIYNCCFMIEKMINGSFFFLICYTNISVDILSSPSSLIQRLTLRVVLDFLENSARTAVSDHFGMKVFTEMRYPWFQTGSNPLC